ncbi:MAG: hypothetical protein QHG99_01085 [Methanomicrobiales archaeon]|nr:hypothetical protein [Methanomicrobiales archaeon]
MDCEYHQKNEPVYGGKSSEYMELLAIEDTERLSITQIIHSISYEKFLYAGLLVLGMGKLLLFARILSWI